MKFDLHRLRLLHELAHRGTLRAVAAAMSYSQSSVSQQLTVLENEIGTPLLQPDGRRVRLTPQAEILVRYTAAVLEQLEQAEASIAASLDSVTGTLRLASIQTAALALVPEVLARLPEQHPGLRVELTLAEPDAALPALLAREFDLVIDEIYPGFPVRRSQEMHHEPIGDDPIRLAFTTAPHAGGLTLADFAHSPWVMEPEDTPGREWTVAICRRAGFEPDVRHETSDVLVQAELVSRGLAVAFLPDLTWCARPPDFHLHRLSAAHARRIVATCRAGSGDNPGITVLRDALRDAYAHSRPVIS